MKTRFKKIDEKQLFLYYCEGENGRLKSYEDVARNFGLTLRSVELLGKKNEWVMKRQEFGEKKFLCFKESREKIIEDAEQKQYEIWSKALKMLEWEMELIAKKQESYKCAIEVDPTGKLARKVGAFDQRQLMEAMKTAINGFRITLGLPTEITKGDLTTKNLTVELTADDIAGMDADLNRLELVKKQNASNTAAN